MGKKILLATEKPFAKIAVQGISEIFKKAGYEMIPLESYKAQEDLLKAVADVDGMIIRSDIVDEAVLAAAANLKIVVRAGAGYDNIDLKAATARSVVAMNTPTTLRAELQCRGRTGVRADALPGARRLFRQVGE
jgi:D-3-phosphoglycerate dehydrogenase